MKVIVGLGNPGREYAGTRHNVGWWVVDHLADVWRFDGWKKDHEALVANGLVGGAKVRLVKPQTLMNNSGEAVRHLLKRPFWAVANDLLVVSDEVALPVGRYRFRGKGSAGGHNGLKSIEYHLHTQDYARLRVGVGPRETERSIGVMTDYVLGDFGKIESGEIRELIPELASGIEKWVADGIVKTMSAFAGKEKSNGE